MPRTRTLLLSSPIILAGLLALSWFDVLPGGWKLRGLVIDHEVRREREQASRVEDRMNTFASENQGAPANAVVFLGSSTMERFPVSKVFKDKPCLSRGIAGESATDLLGRLEERLPTDVAGVVLLTGGVDFREEGVDPAEVRKRLVRVVARIKELRPGVPIALVGILPEADMPAERVEMLAQTNDALESLAKRQEVAWVRTDRSPITDDSGSLSPEASVDTYHLNASGYRRLAAWIIADGGDVGALLVR